MVVVNTIWMLIVSKIPGLNAWLQFIVYLFFLDLELMTRLITMRTMSPKNRYPKRDYFTKPRPLILGEASGSLSIAITTAI